MLFLAGCAHRRPAAAGIPQLGAAGQRVPAGTYVEQGVASWYGYPFHGRRASDGERFDMNKLVAAHRTLPFGSVVQVVNLNNGRRTEVRIIDRGPFVEGRLIDLSFAAARTIDMVGTGIAPVRLELLSSPSPLAGPFTVQVGAFQQRRNAERLKAQLMASYPVFIQDYDAPAGRFYRVRVGRLPNERAAQQLAVQLAKERGFQTFVLRLDELR